MLLLSFGQYRWIVLSCMDYLLPYWHCCNGIGARAFRALEIAQ
jgi:hypothetical protein